MVNRKPQQALLTPGYIAEIVSEKISGDPVMRQSFSETISNIERLKPLLKQSSCASCQYNNHPELVPIFVKEFKTLDRTKADVAIKYMGQRQWIAHGKTKSWINIVDNIIEPYLYETREVKRPAVKHPAPKISIPIVKEKSSTVQVEPLSKLETSSLEMKVSAAVTSTASVFLPVRVEDRVSSSMALPSKSVVVPQQKVRKVIFKNHQAPGDIVMMTAAIRDLHINFPGQFVTGVDTNSMSIWESNPYITKLKESDPGVEVFQAEYPLIQQSNQGPYHFSEGFTEHFEELLGVRIKKRIGRGHIVIGPNEEVWGRTERASLFSPYGHGPDVHYWILNAGYKNDFTAKMWPKERYQKVVDHFAGRIVFVQIGHSAHNHPDLNGVINVVGKTDDRMLIRLVWASSGVLTPCSYPMTLAAAIPVRPGTCNGRSDRPCVVVAGGREPSHWQAYVSHQFIHTCGALPCCDGGGCWKSRIKPIGDGDEKDEKNMCNYVVDSEEGVELPYCMDMITSDEVIRRIEMYYSFYEPNRPKTHTHNRNGA